MQEIYMRSMYMEDITFNLIKSNKRSTNKSNKQVLQSNTMLGTHDIHTILGGYTRCTHDIS